MNDLVEINPLKDKTNPRSLVNITPPAFSRRVETVPDEIFDMSEKELRSAANAGEIEEQLRISFWREYDQANKTNRKMSMVEVYAGVCSNTHFTNRITHDAFKLAYILTQPKDNYIRNADLLNIAYRQVRDILEQSHITKDGYLDSRAADVKVKLFNSLMDRVIGSVVNRSETKTLSLHVASQAEAVTPEMDTLNSIAAIDAKLKELKAKAESEVIDINEEEAEPLPDQS